MHCLDENRASAYVAGSSPDQSAVAEHLSECVSCRGFVLALAKAQSQPNPSEAPTEPRAGRGQPLCPGETVGRYEIEGVLGRGGMGQVYLATDRTLRRQVALKLLHNTDTRSDGFEELQAEAQALAKLEHDNVVTVFDLSVENGVVCIAMQYVSGGSLKGWMRSKRSWRETLRVFLQAGRGLAAAHAVGIVHRDVKPDNILMTEDGRVLVTDFGLAYARAEGEDVVGSGQVFAQVDVAQTQSFGPLAGTPAYMAPEQFRGTDSTSEQSDQFSFCVALYEALYGVRPFLGDSRAELLASIAKGPSAPTSKRGVPRRLQGILMRGLRADARDRYANMVELLNALAKDPWKRGAQVLAASAVLAGLSVSIYAATRNTQEAVQWCEHAGDEVSEVWTADAQAQIGQVFTKGSPIGASLWQQTRQHLDTYGAKWRSASQDACRATHVQHVQSEQLLDKRTACLQPSLVEFSQLIEIFRNAESDEVENAPLAALSLSSVGHCAKLESFNESVQPPQPELAAKVVALRSQLAQSKAYREAGDYDAAQSLSSQALAEAETLGYMPLLAESLLVEGAVENHRGKSKEASALFERASLVAEEAGDDRSKASALLHLLDTRAGSLADIEGAAAIIKSAKATAARLGDDEVMALYLLAAGRYYRTSSDFAAAESTLTEGLQLARSAMGPNSPVVATGLIARAGVYTYQGDYEKAFADRNAALAIRRSVYGPNHAMVGRLLIGLADTLLRKGDSVVDAIAMTSEGLSILIAALGADNPAIAGARTQLGRYYLMQGDASKAMAEQLAAVEIVRTQLGDKDSGMADILHHLGTAQILAGSLDDAIASHAKALAIRETTFGKDHPLVGWSHDQLGQAHTYAKNLGLCEQHLRISIAVLSAAQGEDYAELLYPYSDLGECLSAQRKWSSALGAFRHALALAETQFEPDNHDWIYPLKGLALIHLELDRPEQAKPLLERALKLSQKQKGIPSELAQVEFALARAYVGEPGKRVQAIALARQALRNYESGPDAIVGDDRRAIAHFLKRYAK